VLCKPNKKQSKVQNNTYTLSRNVGTFNIRYNVRGLVLMKHAGLNVGDIGNWNVIAKRDERCSKFVSRESRQVKSRSYFNVLT